MLDVDVGSAHAHRLRDDGIGKLDDRHLDVCLRRRFLPSPGDVVGEIAGVLDSSGLPAVFIGLEPVPLQPVDTPTNPEANRIAAAAEASTARVVSIACTTPR